MPDNMSQGDIDALIKSLLTGESPAGKKAGEPTAADAAAAVVDAIGAPGAEAPVLDLAAITDDEVARAEAEHDAIRAGQPGTHTRIPPVLEPEPVAGVGRAAFAIAEAPVMEPTEALASLVARTATPPPAMPIPAPVTRQPVFPTAGVPVTVSILMDLRLTLTVRLGVAHMKLKDVLNLAPGAVVTLNSLAHEPLDVMINSIPVMRAEAVVIGENYGVRITETMVQRHVAAS